MSLEDETKFIQKVDHQYIEDRNRLIPIAERYADKVHGKYSKLKYDNNFIWQREWTQCFLERMEYLARKSGIKKR